MLPAVNFVAVYWCFFRTWAACFYRVVADIGQDDSTYNANMIIKRTPSDALSTAKTFFSGSISKSCTARLISAESWNERNYVTNHCSVFREHVVSNKYCSCGCFCHQEIWGTVLRNILTPQILKRPHKPYKMETEFSFDLHLFKKVQYIAQFFAWKTLYLWVKTLITSPKKAVCERQLLNVSRSILTTIRFCWTNNLLRSSQLSSTLLCSIIFSALEVD